MTHKKSTIILRLVSLEFSLFESYIKYVNICVNQSCFSIWPYPLQVKKYYETIYFLTMYLPSNFQARKWIDIEKEHHQKIDRGHETMTKSVWKKRKIKIWQCPVFLKNNAEKQHPFKFVDSKK